MAVLLIADHDHVSLKAVTKNLVTAARDCGDDIHVLVVGSECHGAAQEASRLNGVTKVLCADAPHFAHDSAENVAAQILAIAPAYTHILAADSAYGKSILPRVAAKLDVAQISEVILVVSADTFERNIYAGNAVATVQSQDAIKVMTIRSTCFLPVESGESQAEVQACDVVESTQKSRFISREVTQSERPELPAAKYVVACGRGIGDAENVHLVTALADKLGAAVGASRAAVDAGYVPNDWQIGQTGKMIAPDLYIGVGLSGAIQHVAGLKNAKTIVAINKDPDAPIFLSADYGIVGDLFEIVPELIDALG